MKFAWCRRSDRDFTSASQSSPTKDQARWSSRQLSVPGTRWTGSFNVNVTSSTAASFTLRQARLPCAGVTTQTITITIACIRSMKITNRDCRHGNADQATQGATISTRRQLPMMTPTPRDRYPKSLAIHTTKKGTLIITAQLSAARTDVTLPFTVKGLVPPPRGTDFCITQADYHCRRCYNKTITIYFSTIRSMRTTNVIVDMGRNQRTQGATSLLGFHSVDDATHGPLTQPRNTHQRNQARWPSRQLSAASGHDVPAFTVNGTSTERRRHGLQITARPLTIAAGSTTRPSPSLVHRYTRWEQRDRDCRHERRPSHTRATSLHGDITVGRTPRTFTLPTIQTTIQARDIRPARLPGADVSVLSPWTSLHATAAARFGSRQAATIAAVLHTAITILLPPIHSMKIRGRWLSTWERQLTPTRGNHLSLATIRWYAPRWPLPQPRNQHHESGTCNHRGGGGPAFGGSGHDVTCLSRERVKYRHRGVRITASLQARLHALKYLHRLHHHIAPIACWEHETGLSTGNATMPHKARPSPHATLPMIRHPHGTFTLPRILHKRIQHADHHVTSAASGHDVSVPFSVKSLVPTAAGTIQHQSSPIYHCRGATTQGPSPSLLPRYAWWEQRAVIVDMGTPPMYARGTISHTQHYRWWRQTNSNHYCCK